jgi:hypothetical protein
LNLGISGVVVSVGVGVLVAGLGDSVGVCVVAMIVASREFAVWSAMVVAVRGRFGPGVCSMPACSVLHPSLVNAAMQIRMERWVKRLLRMVRPTEMPVEWM